MMLAKSEIESRVEKFYSLMNEKNPQWDIAVVFDRVTQYYFTGTMQNSVLIFTNRKGAYYFFTSSSAILPFSAVSTS